MSLGRGGPSLDHRHAPGAPTPCLLQAVLAHTPSSGSYSKPGPLPTDTGQVGGYLLATPEPVTDWVRFGSQHGAVTKIQHFSSDRAESDS